MPISIFPIGPLETNAYVVHEGRDAVIVDPGGDLRGGLTRILDFLKQNTLTLHAVLLTHLHFDHVLGVANLVEKFPGLKVYGSEKDDPILRPLFSSETWGMPQVAKFTYESIPPGEHAFGALALQVIPSPGHSEGSLCFYFAKDKAVIVGDLLFYRSIGRTDFPGGNHQQLIDSLQKHIYLLPPDTIAHPGHGPETRVGDEIHQNPFVRGL